MCCLFSCGLVFLTTYRCKVIWLQTHKTCLTVRFTLFFLVLIWSTTSAAILLRILCILWIFLSIARSFAIWSFRLTAHGVDVLVCWALILFHEIELFSRRFVRFANTECLVHIQILFFEQSYLRTFVLDSYYDPVPIHLVRERVILVAKRTGSDRCSSPVPSS